MAKTLQEWLDTDVASVRGRSVRWLSERHFFRDPLRSPVVDAGFFFSPADGIVLYQRRVTPDEPLIEIKGTPYTLQQAMRADDFDHECLVIGVFMTFYDVHVNRVPYSGRLSYKELDPLETKNRPMLDVELGLLEELHVDLDATDYLHTNQRVLNRIYAPRLQQWYYVLQIADYDVDCITPFELKQNQPALQNARFSQIRYGSQVDLIVPLTGRLELSFVQSPGLHVEAGLDPLLRVAPKG